jgi:hypothetical protein
MHPRSRTVDTAWRWLQVPNRAALPGRYFPAGHTVVIILIWNQLFPFSLVCRSYRPFPIQIRSVFVDSSTLLPKFTLQFPDIAIGGEFWCRCSGGSCGSADR